MEIQRYNEDIQQQLNSSPAVGDVYIPKISTYSGDILKIISIEDNGIFGCLCYDFASIRFIETDRNKISLRDLQEYYRKTLNDFDCIASNVIFNNQSLLEQANNDQSTELSTLNKKSKDDLIAYSHKMELLVNQAEEYQIILKCYIEYKKSLLNEQLKAFNGQVSQYKNKIKRSIDKNDALAYKMITTRIKTLIKNDRKE